MEGRRQDDRDDMMWNEKLEIEDGAPTRSLPRSLSRADAIGRRSHKALASAIPGPEKGCQPLPSVFDCNVLRINDRCPKQVSRNRGGFVIPFSNFQFRRFVQNRRPACPEQRRGERPKGAEGRCFAAAIYPTMFSSRIGCNSVKTKHRCLGYPTINPGGLEPSLTGSGAPPRLITSRENV